MQSSKKSQPGASGQKQVDLFATLVDAGGSLAPEELFRQANLAANEQAKDVELFYEKLAEDVEENLIVEKRSGLSSVVLEAVPGAEREPVEEEEDEEEISDEDVGVEELDEADTDEVPEPSARPQQKQDKIEAEPQTLWDMLQ
jgi:hypothetical protein